MVTLIKYGALSGGEKYNVNQMWIDGLSTDSKPTTTVEGLYIPNGSVYTEVDTGKTYMFDKDNVTWYEVSIGGGGGGGTSGGIILVGETTTALTDNATTNPITINGSSYTAQPNDAVIYGNKEFLFDGTKWHEFGDLSGLSSKDIGSMTNYVIAQTGAAINTSDTLNQAMGKVEKRVSDNENNISLIEQANGSKNVFDITDTYFVSSNVTYTLDSSTSTLNASITNQTYRRIMWNTKLKAGVEYTIMLDVSAIDNPIQIYPTTSDTAASSPWGTIDILATGSYTMNFTATAETTYLALYLAYGTSTTNDVEIENIMIVPKNLKDAGFTDFQPYAMSNAELTAAIKSIQAQLANQ